MTDTGNRPSSLLRASPPQRSTCSHRRREAARAGWSRRRSASASRPNVRSPAVAGPSCGQPPHSPVKSVAPVSVVASAGERRHLVERPHDRGARCEAAERRAIVHEVGDLVEMVDVGFGGGCARFRAEDRSDRRGNRRSPAGRSREAGCSCHFKSPAATCASTALRGRSRRMYCVTSGS